MVTEPITDGETFGVRVEFGRETNRVAEGSDGLRLNA
jgi:hypothetical protein